MFFKNPQNRMDENSIQFQMKRLIIVCLSLLLFAGTWISCVVPVVAHSKESPADTATIVLTAEEREWLKQNPYIKLISFANQQPFSMKGQDEKPSGIMVDLFSHLNRAIGQELELESFDNQENLHVNAKKTGVYGCAAVFKTPRHRNEYLLTDPYFHTPFYVFTKNNNLMYFKQPGDLKGKRVAILKGHRALAEYLDELGGVEKVVVASPLEQMQKVVTGEADAMLGYITYPYLINKYLMVDLVMAFVAKSDLDLHIGVNPEHPVLRNILNKAIATISEESKQSILNKWAEQSRDASPQVALTAEEKNWLAKGHMVRARISDWPPFMFQEPQPSGIAVDYLNEVAKRTGLKIQYVPDTIGWKKSLQDLMEDQKQQDLILTINHTEERAEQIIFSDDYLFMPWVIITHEDSSFIGGLRDLSGKIVSVEQGYVMQEKLQDKYPAIQQLKAATSLAALKAVSTGQADAYVGNLANSTFLMRQHGLGNLKVAAPTSFEGHVQAMGVRRDWPELASIISRSIAAMTPDEHNAIRSKWLSVHYEPGIQLQKVIRWAGLILFAVTIILGIFLQWNRKLSREIQRRLVSEAALSERETLLRTLVEQSMDGISLVDHDGRYILVNLAFRKLTGYSEQELLQMKLFDLRAPDGPKLFSELKAIHQPFRRETMLQRKDGSIFVAEVSASPIQLKNKVQFLGVVRDITRSNQAKEEVKQAREATESANRELLANRQQLEAIIDNLPAVFFTKDLKGRYLMVNRRYEEAVGLKKELVIGQTDQGIMPPEVADTLMQIDQRVLADNVSVTIEEKIPHPDGTVHDYQTTKVPLIDDQGTILIGMALDITKRKINEENLHREVKGRQDAEEELKKAKERAEAANQAKSLFLANMSHELRSPLNAVLGYSQLMGRDAALTPQQRENIVSINRSGEHLLALINDVLEIAKIESGKISLLPVDFDLGALLDELEKMFILRTTAKKMTLVFQKDSSLPHYVRGDQRKISQCLANLLGNALKYTNTGNITLRARAATDNSNGSSKLTFEIEDSGIGISPEHFTEIMKPFMRTSDDDSKHDGGAGLGLAITKEYARLMAGDVRVLQSSPERGSIFELTITVDPASSTATKQQKAEPTVVGLAPGQVAPRILVADDNADNRRVLSQLLKSIDCEVEEVCNGQEALDRLSVKKPDLIFMDIKMPVMDGYKVIRRIKRQPGWQEIPIVAVTAYAFDEDRERSLVSGADDYLSKPFKDEAIFALLKHYLGLTFLYQEPSCSSGDTLPGGGQFNIEDLAELPETFLQELRQTASDLDKSACQALIEGIKNKNNAMYFHLQKLITEFRFEEILVIANQRNSKNE